MMALLYNKRVLAINASKTLSSQTNFTGVDVQTFRIEKSARLVFHLVVTSITGTLTFALNTTSDINQDTTEAATSTITTIGSYSIPATDVQRYNNTVISCTNATYTLGVVLAENSDGPAAIESASILQEIDDKTPPLGQATMAESSPVVIASDQSPLPVSASALPLPSGAATSALQTTGNASLSSIDTKVATSTKQDTGNTSLASIDGKVATAANQTSELTKLDTLHTDLTNVQTKQDTGNSSLSSIDGKVATSAKQDTGNTSLSSIDTKLSTTNTQIGSLTETAPATDTASSGLNGRLQRIAQRLTTVDTDLNTFASANHTDLGSIKTDIDSTNTKLDTANTHLANLETNTDGIETLITSTNTKLDTTNTHLTNLETYTDGLEALITSTNTKLDTLHTDNGVIESKQDTGNTSLASIDTKLTTTNTEIGATNETAPATDTATSGLNGRLQRIAQRLSTLIALYNPDFGASSGGIRTASQIGNATGAANFNAGTTGAQTLRTASNLYDSSGNGITSRITNGSQRGLDVGIVDGPQLDSYGRLRVAGQDLVFGSTFANGLNTLLFNTAVVGSATLTSVTNQAAARLTTTTGATDSITVQSKRYLRYNPGVSHQIAITGVIGAKKANVRQRWGYFDANDGLFFEQTASDIAIVLRTSTSGSPVDTRVVQASWNLDKLDGTGTSGITLDTTKHNAFFIDFVWQGAGRIRFGLLSGINIVYFHQIITSNTNTAPFMRSPSRPGRIELTNLGATSGSTTMDIVCVYAIRETTDDLLPPFAGSASRGTTAIVVSTIKPLISLRPKSTFGGITNRVPIVPVSTALICNQQAILVQVYLNATLTGASFTSAGTNSAAEFDVSATVVSGGTLLLESYINAAGIDTLDLTSLSDSAILGLDIAGSVQDTITITATSLAGNTSTWAQIAWQEFQ